MMAYLGLRCNEPNKEDGLEQPVPWEPFVKDALATARRI
jgi:hypothetical protein